MFSWQAEEVSDAANHAIRSPFTPDLHVCHITWNTMQVISNNNNNNNDDNNDNNAFQLMMS